MQTSNPNLNLNNPKLTFIAQVQPLQGVPQVTINDFREYLGQMAELMQRFEVL